MMGERGIDLAHTTILRWLQHYTPEFQKRWQRFERTVGGSWRMDETYVRVKGRWTYLYRRGAIRVCKGLLSELKSLRLVRDCVRRRKGML
jgi:transposase-like protein